ncbi:universal stress protein [Gandjariella thermophila]|uniref:Universal stress protein n=1 Tax=Gandjariella thermophila TaxID=1931992 RepID=A0A4D4JAG1_9PSEU|nr:universal stress protein [Gandjariella thermophila]GDY33805.1 universal stress protein [Gandjariella thermophila]
MVGSARTSAIVVGVDGSMSALHAVQWAAADAARRHLPLRLVHGLMFIHATYPGASTASQGLYDGTLAQGREWLRQAREAALAVSASLDVDTDMVESPPVPLLLEQSTTARTVVLGSRGLGGFTGLLVGSTAVALAAHGHCPVTVVRGRTLDQPPPTDGPVVVGVDGSPASEAAIELGFDESSFRRVDLVAVHAWSDITAAKALDMPGVNIIWNEVRMHEERLLAERLAGWQEKYPDVRVRRIVVRDRPVRGLLAQGEHAQLIVVGSRGRGGFAGMLLGSTSQALLHHAPCPVTVTRPERAR